MATPPSAGELLRNEYDEVVTVVCNKRKVYPANCASVLSKTLKIENNIAMNTTIDLQIPFKSEVDSSPLSSPLKEGFKELLLNAESARQERIAVLESIDSLVKKQEDISNAVKQIKNNPEDIVAKHLI